MVAKAKAKVDETAPRDGESLEAHVLRLKGMGTDAAVTALLAIVEHTDDDARLSLFGNRVRTSWVAGHALVAKATLVLGAAPDGFPAATAAVGITDKNRAKWYDRAYSTLRECWDIATHHTDERRESFVAAYAAAHGRNPESVREYAQWLRAEAKGGETAAKNTVETLRTRKAAAAKVKAAAEAKATERREAQRLVVKAKATAAPKARPIAGVPMTAEQWDALTVEQLRAVELLAASMAAAKAKAIRDAAKAAEANATAAATGPQPAARPRRTVAA